MKQFLALLEKDWRVYQIPIVGLVLAGLLPYLFALGICSMEGHKDIYSVNRIGATTIYNAPNPFSMFNDAANIALLCTAIVASAFGGVAFAQERRDRSGEWLAMLTTRRWSIMSSKLLVTLGCMGVAIIVHGEVKHLCDIKLARSGNDTFVIIAAWAIYSLGMFGIAWAFSTFLCSPTIAACIGIAASLLISMYIGIFLAPPGYKYVEYLTYLTIGTLGLTGILFGNIYYLRRFAP
jgi:ABC-type transport system involved in multi-copper enzyme maturation permease subunit